MNKKIIIVFTFVLSLFYNQLFAQSSFHVDVKGSGKLQAVLIPGFSCSGDVWNATVAQLSQKYTCYVITFLGYAGEPAQSDPHLYTWVVDIANYIQDKHLKQPVVIGHSIGGVLAMWLSADYPSLISKIVVVDALPCLAALQQTNFVAKPNPDCNSFVNQYIHMSDSNLYTIQKRMMPMMCADTAMLPTIINWSVKSDRKTMGQTYCEFINTDLRDTLSRIQCSALLLLEPSFKAIDSKVNQQFSKLANKTLVYATKGLHFIMYDDKDWYLQQLKNDLL